MPIAAVTAKLVPRLHRVVRGFCRAQSGNVAVIFGIAIIPLMVGIGAAIDYSRANSVRADLQAALDSTALMLSKEAASDTSAQLQANALKYFTANFNRPGTTIGSISVNYATTGGTQIVVNGTVNVPTDFMQIFGVNSIPVGGSSTVKWGMSRLRVALVLDNTGSMAQDGKIAALKTATANLLAQLQSAATTNGDVYVSIIPFVKDVNLDPANYNAPWIDWTEWDKANTTCAGKSGGKGQGNNCNKPANHTTWNGCVMDRGGQTAPDPADYDTNVDAPTPGVPATLFAAEQYSSCPQAAMGLSYDWPAMTTLVNGMSPGGSTNQAIGLALGWMSLTGGGPFVAPPMDPNYTYQQVIILLTDGLNTEDRWYKSQNSIDTRQSMTCDNIKAAGITLYTIQVDTGGDPTSTLLQQCASSPDKFFLLTSANQIVSTFSTIGTNLSNLYIAK